MAWHQQGDKPLSEQVRKTRDYAYGKYQFKKLFDSKFIWEENYRLKLGNV